MDIPAYGTTLLVGGGGGGVGLLQIAISLSVRFGCRYQTFTSTCQAPKNASTTKVLAQQFETYVSAVDRVHIPKRG
jgi:hypothetical protein